MNAHPARPSLPRGPLIDRFGRRHSYLRISITERCNLRCTYCMPPEGIELKPREEILSFEEIERLARIFAEMGINKIRLTGGEPLVRKNVERLIERLAAIPGIGTIAMTTNAVLLAERVATLRRLGLDALNISLDTLRPERFRRIALRDSFEQVMRGIDAALAAGFAPLKLNMVVMRGINDDELLDFVDLARDAPIHVRFIEYMPFSGNAWERRKLFSYREMLERIRVRYPLEPVAERGGADVAADYGCDELRGRVGFITSMTNDFCGGCNRLRLLADGAIKSCLFYPPEDNLRLALRRGDDDDEIEQIIRRVIGLKREKHAALDDLAALPNNSMIQIGG